MRQARAVYELTPATLEGHRGYLASQAARMGVKRGDIEDLIQDTLLRAVKHAESYDPSKASVGNWLWRIMNNLVVDQWRRRRSVRFVSLDWEDEKGEEMSFADIIADPDADPHVALGRSELSEQMQAALDSLPDYYREAILLVDTQDVSYEECAQITEANIGTVRSRLHRGRELLRKRLLKDGYDGYTGRCDGEARHAA